MISDDSNVADNCIYFLSAVSDYCMVCFFRQVKKKSDISCIKERYIYTSLCITCISVELMWLCKIMFSGTSERMRQCKLRFFYINMNFIKQNIHILCNMKSYECHLMKIIKKLVINLISTCDFCDSSLWLEKWLGFSVSWWSPSFRCKAYLKLDTVVGLTRSPLKRYKIHVCLRNFNYEISIVLNLAPCTFTGCCHIDPGSQP